MGDAFPLAEVKLLTQPVDRCATILKRFLASIGPDGGELPSPAWIPMESRDARPCHLVQPDVRPQLFDTAPLDRRSAQLQAFRHGRPFLHPHHSCPTNAAAAPRTSKNAATPPGLAVSALPSRP